MALFPMFANLTGRRVLVVGGGEIAERKVRLLLSAGASIRVVAPEICASLRELASAFQIELRDGFYTQDCLDDVWFVVAATCSQSVNRQVASDAEDRRLMVNVVDDAELSTFQVPAIVDRSPVVIAISSSGAAPMIARWVRERIEGMFGLSLGKLASFAQKHRKTIREACPDLDARRELYDWMIRGGVSALLQSNQNDQAERQLFLALGKTQGGRPGHVSLLETGSGQSGLLSMDALRALSRADIIFYDRQVPESVLQLARRDATSICLKEELEPDCKSTREWLHALLLHCAQGGQSVVLLRSGNVFSLGEAWRDVSFLSQACISYQIIPAVLQAQTAALGCGVPLMHESVARSVQIVDVGRYLKGSAAQWSYLTTDSKTLVQEVPQALLVEYCAGLVANGKSDRTCCIAVARCGHDDQFALTGNLKTIASLVRRENLEGPVTLLVGDVAGFAKSMHGFDDELSLPGENLFAEREFLGQP